MRVGISLPQFRHEAEPAIQTARKAEVAGVDGVFVFDHLWPLGRPDRPALHATTLLGALSSETERVTLGTLVARVGVAPDAVLVHTLISLARMAGGRFIAGLGTGDRANRDENLAYGLPYPPAAERLASLKTCVGLLRQAGVSTWVGGLSSGALEAAAAADGWNGWGVAPAQVASHVRHLRSLGVGEGFEATWAGQVLVARTAAHAQAKLERFGPRPGLVVGTVEDLAAHLRALAEAGARWAVCAPLDVGTDPETVELVAEAAAQPA